MLHKLILIIPFMTMIAWSAAAVATAAAADEDFKQTYAHARQKMQSGDYPAAGIELNKALNAAQLSSEEVSVLFDLSYVSLKMSKLDEAMKYLEQITDIPDLSDNDRDRVYIQMADVHIAAQKYDEAVEDCKEGLSKATANLDKYRLLMKAAHAMNVKKDYSAALDYARQALELCQDNAPNLLVTKRTLVGIYSALEDYPGVTEVFTRQELDAMSADVRKSVYPALVNAYLKVARSRQADKDYAKAIEIYDLLEKDKKVKPEQRAEAYLWEANALKMQKKYSEAIRNYYVVLSFQDAKPDHKKIAQKELDQLQALLTKQQPDSNDKKDNGNASAGDASIIAK